MTLRSSVEAAAVAVAVALVEVAEEAATSVAWVEAVATLVGAAGMEATLLGVVVVAITRAGAVVADTSAVEAAGASMPVGIGMVVGMSAAAADASMLGTTVPGGGMATATGGTTTIASTSFANTSTISTITLLGSESDGGPGTTPTDTAMVDASG